MTTYLLSCVFFEPGKKIGAKNLCPHDLGYYRTTQAMRNKIDITNASQAAGNWRSPALPLRYMMAAEIANDGCW